MTAAATIAPRRPPSRFIRIWRWMKSDPRAVLSISYLVILLFVAIFAPVLAPIRRWRRMSRNCCCRRAPNTGSAPTISAATC